MEKLTLSRYLQPCPRAAVLLDIVVRVLTISPSLCHRRACPGPTAPPASLRWCARRGACVAAALGRAGLGHTNGHISTAASTSPAQPIPAQPDSVIYTRNCSRFTLWALGGGCFDTEARDNEVAVSTNCAPTLFILIILPFLLSGAGSGPRL